MGAAGARFLAGGASRADLHVHTTYSDGTVTPIDVLNSYALREEIRVLAITDHDTMDGAKEAAEFAAAHPELFGHLEVIVGEEVTSRDGHVVALFLREWIPPGMSAEETVRAVHEQGGIAIAAHPYTSLMRWNGLVGVGDLILTVPFDAVETRNSNFTEVFSNRKAARRAAGRPQVGSSDGHFMDAVGLCWTEFPGTTAADFRAAVEAGVTRPGGSCYGVPTLARYVLTRLRTGGSLLPVRSARTHRPSAPDFELVVHADSGIDGAVLSPTGRLDALSYRLLKEPLELLARARVGAVVDLSRVDFLDSSGVTALVAGLKASRAVGVGFVLASPSPAAVRTLEIARLRTVFPESRDVREGRALVAAMADGTANAGVRARGGVS